MSVPPRPRCATPRRCPYCQCWCVNPTRRPWRKPVPAVLRALWVRVYWCDSCRSMLVRVVPWWRSDRPVPPARSETPSAAASENTTCPAVPAAGAGN
jgi:hypothetical protein